MLFQTTASLAPLAIVFTLILGALWRCRCARPITRRAAKTALATLLPLTLVSYLTPINLLLWAALMLLGLGAALTAVVTAPKALLLIEPLVFPMCLFGLTWVTLWF